jgi:ATP-dependent 26S proteasome regulatory subunit
LREELQLLQEPGSYVAEVVKLMGKTKVLVKVKYLHTAAREYMLHGLEAIDSGIYQSRPA